MTQAPSTGSAHQSVERALSLLSAFDDSTSELGVAELARAVGLHRSTVSRLASTMERAGYLRKTKGGYRLGVEMIRLGSLALSTFDLVAAMRPVMEELSRLTQETVNLAVPDGANVLHVAEIPSAYILASSTGWAGRTTAPHASANGKVLLAYGALPLPVGPRLETFTPLTLPTVEALEEELDRVRARGYATAISELEQGLVAVGAPVWDGGGGCIAAISVSGPQFRLDEETVDRIGRICRDLRSGDHTSKVSAGSGLGAPLSTSYRNPIS
ncbi:MAG: IclR family transcriptional regulator [Actinomycetota bacterium]|nr:IclR family transcriptional regulator [Actinomycetota bacterium]